MERSARYGLALVRMTVPVVRVKLKKNWGSDRYRHLPASPIFELYSRLVQYSVLFLGATAQDSALYIVAKDLENRDLAATQSLTLLYMIYKSTSKTRRTATVAKIIKDFHNYRDNPAGVCLTNQRMPPNGRFREKKGQTIKTIVYSGNTCYSVRSRALPIVVKRNAPRRRLPPQQPP